MRNLSRIALPPLAITLAFCVLWYLCFAIPPGPADRWPEWFPSPFIVIFFAGFLAAALTPLNQDGRKLRRILLRVGISAVALLVNFWALLTFAVLGGK